MPDTRMWRILNVDDNEAGRYATTRILKNAGFDVIEAANGADALALATDQHPDFVLLDVNLPDISGLEVARRLKQNTKTASIPVVHLSAVFMNSKDRVLGLEGGADGYLVHPIEPEELVATVRSFLRIRKAEMALQESEEKFRTLAESTPVAIMIYQGDNWVYSNPAGELMSGYSCEELYSMRYWDFVAPEFRQLVRERGRQRQAGEYPPGPYDFRIVTKEGTGKWVSLTGNQFRFKGEPAVLISVIDITGRKQVNEALKESEERLSRFNESGLFGAIYWTMDGKITDANDTFLMMVGYTRDDLVSGRIDWQSMTPPEFRYLDERSVEELKATGVNANPFKKEYIRKDGTRLPILIAGAMLDEERFRGIAILLDISEQKLAEEKIMTSETRYRRLFESAKDGILILDRDTSEIIDANPFIKILTGYAREELIGKKLWDIGFFSDQLASKSAFLELQKTDYIRYENLPLETKDGKRIEVEFISNVYSIDQNLSVIQCSIRDITERRIAEDSLKQSEERYRTLFERMDEGFCVIEMLYDPDGKATDYRFLEINPAFEKQTGLRQAQGKTIREMVPNHDSHWFEIYGNVAQTGESIRFENPAVAMQRYYDVFAFRVGGEKSRKVGVLFNDISGRKAAEENKERLICKLEHQNAELERFTYTISHELRSPLITIKWFAGLLEDNLSKNDLLQMKTDAHRITDAAGTMQSLLLDLLELSQIGRIAKPPEKIGFNLIVKEALDLLAAPLAERNVTVEIAPDLPDIYVDHARIREVMVNLIENAIKFSFNQPDRVIRIGVDDTGETPVFFVQDNGIGIDHTYLERIFNLFERLDTSTHGTGIGLTIVRRIIEVHGGKIWAESDGPGTGTTFRFTLPGMSGEGDVPVPEVV
ncbi:MAG: PAS domain S-box protein [Methanoregula sp.]|nr:PAS domain S-box protein [Methanoregula sp.]